MDVRSPFFQNIATVLIGVMFLNPIVSTAADLAVDAAAGGNTSLGAAANGVPVVNIATPNGNGLSHNKFSDYNVGEQGLILNNATNKLQSTQLGGYILGNPNLNGRAAGVILNEVTGTNPSQLKGYTEVAGQGAHVIVANPHGITCDGCGFINTPRATLSTGAPVVENGALKRYDVDGGQIRIEGQGLNASNVDQFELITRSAQINAELHARQLAMVTGRNDVDAATLAATAKADDGTDKPQLAIDSSALGGMYAGAIRLVGTEQGVGVKLAGDMAASGGDIQIDANGKLTLARTAASGNLTANATDIELTRSTYASGNARLTTGTLDNQERLAAGGDLRLNATHIDNPGRLEAGVRSDGSANTAHPDSALDIQGGTLRNRGTVNAQGSLTTDLATLDNQGAELVATGSARIKASTLDNRQGGQLIGRQDLTLDGQTLDNRGGTVASNKALTVTARDRLDNSQDGLILSKADGLTLDTAVLNNQNGTVQADSGELKATASTLDNRNGKLLTGQGALTVDAQDLRNQQGRLIAQNGTLTARSDTLDNTAGRLQGDSVDLTTRTRLDNSQGHITATQGNLSLTRGELLNDNGQIQAKHSLTVNADSLRNHSGSLGADTIDLTLGGLLDNSGGLVEAAQTLSLDLNDARNTNGKLRALGSSGESVFRLGGRFDNDNGLVEIGNAAFRLSSTQLSNQGGTLRHVGNQGFGLNLADAGQAGGRFLTNGTLSLDVADWTNSSLLQAQRIDLKVGRFTQTATGQLVSASDLVIRGGDWQNDGKISADGSIDLQLDGHYSGNGQLVTQQALAFTAQGADLGQNARITAVGNADFTLGGTLLNRGVVTSDGTFNLKVNVLDNQGTLGARTGLELTADTLQNTDGLIYSGAGLKLAGQRFTNLRGDLYSIGDLTFDSDGKGGQSAAFRNLSGVIESEGQINLRADLIENAHEVENLIVSRKVAALFYDRDCTNCGGSKRNVRYRLREIDRTEATASGRGASLLAGGNLTLTGQVVNNRFSLMGANGNLLINADTYNGIGAEIGETVTERRVTSPRLRSVGHIDVAVNSFNQSYWPASGGDVAGAVNGMLASYFESAEFFGTTYTPGTTQGYRAVVQAGGDVQINATQQLGNTDIKPSFTFVNGGKRVDTGAPGTDVATTVTLNPQVAPDLQQKPVDPLTLPSFSLPQGQNGMFHVVSNPGHPYLIETNPAFASLGGFLSSSYMLDLLGYSSETAQKRLGDGFYEQRLIRDAVVARTGKRLLDGLASDEAQFKYLMDNAIASKESLKLVPGISLSAEQVAALTHDIVWMEEREVQGEKVLVPVLYLAQAKDRLAPGGSLIQGRNVALISGSNLHNSGTLRATQNLTATASDITNSGLMQANERLQLLATGSIRNAQGGVINGKDVTLTAGKDVINERSVTVHRSQTERSDRQQSFVDDAARIEAGNGLSITAGNDLQNIGGALKSGADTRLNAGRDLLLVSAEAENRTHTWDRKGYGKSSSLTQYGSEVDVGGNLTATAGRDIAVVASHVKATGDVALTAQRDVSISAAANETHSESFRKSGGKKVQAEDSQVRQQASVVEAGGDLNVKAGGNLVVAASQLKAGDEAYLYAGEQLALLAAQDSDYHLFDKKNKGSFGAKETRRDEVTDVRNVGTQITSGGNLTLASEGDQLYQHARLESGGNLTLDSGGAITFEAVKDLHQESHEKSKSDLAWNSMKGKGSTDETLLQSQLIAQGEIVIKAADGLKIDIKQIDQKTVSQTIDAMVAADPQLAWIKAAEQRGDVDWRQVKEIHDAFKYSNSGLGAGAQLVIAIVMAAVVGPAAAGALGTVGGAAATSLATTGTISTINNKGNLGAALKETFSKDSLKSAAVAGVTAGLTSSYLDDAFGVKPENVNHVTKGFDIGTLNGFGNYGGYLAAQGGVQAVTKTAIQGGSFEENLKVALTSQGQQLLQAGVFNWVGGVSKEMKWGDGSPQKVAFHALMGGLLSKATGGDFATGAAAAGASEALIERLSGLTQGNQNLEQMSAQIIGVLAAATVNGDINKGAEIAKSSTTYNRQLHPDERKLAELLAERSGGKYTTEQIEEQLRLAYYKTENGEQSPGNDIVVSKDGIYDDGGKWQDLGNGKYLQVYAKLDPDVIAYIRQATQGYSWAAVNDPPAIDWSKTPSVSDDRRDRLSGRVLDAGGGYRTPTDVDGQYFNPRFFPCATGECAGSGVNVDLNDPETQRWIAADNAKAVEKALTVSSFAPVPAGLWGRLMGRLFGGGEKLAAETAGSVVSEKVTAGVVKKTGEAAQTVKSNKISGDAARDFIANREGGVIEQNFRVTGGLRRVDVVKEGLNTVAIESKVGRTSLDSRVRQELARDVKLLRSGQVDKVVWEFSESAKTGKVGPTPALQRKLEKFGIEIRYSGQSF